MHVAPLACIHWAATNASLQIDDCRRIFSPLTALSPAAATQAIHVDQISWANDDVMTLDQLIANGLAITLDQAAESPVTGANFVVTLEPPWLPAKLERFELQQPLPTILRTMTILDSQISVAGSVLSWLLPWNEDEYYQLPILLYVDELLMAGALAGVYGRVRVRLLGQAIYTRTLAGTQLYLDGQAFGSNALRQDGTTPRIDLQLPSGTDLAATDFDSWFYLAPVLTLTSLTVAYPALTAVLAADSSLLGVEATGTPGLVDPTATVTVNYPAAVATTMTLTLTGASGVGTVAGLPATATIEVGESSLTFPIYVLTSPPYSQTLTFTITASLSTAGGLPASTQTATFTVTGALEPAQ
jgi:hypothetical protein